MMKAILTSLLIFCAVLVFSQDAKFAQFFASPITQNPANIGYFDGKYRFASNTRRQWANLGDPFVTTSLSGEYKFGDEYYRDDLFSIGANALFENAFNGVLKTSVAGFGFSYYKFFDADHKVRFGLAPHLAYLNKSLDYSKLTFASQYKDGGFSSALPNYIGIDNAAINYVDLSIGANLAVSGENYNYYVGYSAFHLTRPNESITDNYTAKLSIRHTVGVGFQYLTHDLLDFNFTAYRMTQGSSHTEVLGAVVGFKPAIDSKAKLNLGLWQKIDDGSLFPYLGLEFANVNVGLNYTVLSKQINDVRPRTFELSLIITDKNFTKFRNTCKF